MNNSAAIVFCFIVGSPAWARVEYAVQNRIPSCTACHVSPFGGGPRYVEGKLYGSRFDKPSPWSLQDIWSADARAMAYYPSGGSTGRQGTALMETTIAANIPVIQNPHGSELRAVAAYSIGVVDQGPRDIYGQWLTAPREDSPIYIQFGRMNAPFGMPTDEHRTYTKLLTRTGIFDYEMGGSMSAQVGDSVNYDFAVTNGLQTGGMFNSNSPTTPDSTGAAFLNGRWMPVSLPLMLGASAEYQERVTPNHSPYAASTYFALSLDRLSSNWVSGALLGEVVYARNWNDPAINPNINKYFVPATDTDYQATILDQSAIAWYLQLNINFWTRWVAQYKFDSLTFGPGYGGDRFLRNGVGFKYYASSNIIVMTRYEFASAGRSEIKGTSVYGAQNAFWAMLQLWL